MKVTYLNHMGDDLTVVNAARVSFGKNSEWAWVEKEKRMGDGEWVPVKCDPHLSEKDKKLISYLAKHNHWTPFAHCQVSLHLKVPFFVAAQVKKHQVGFVVNEVSRRYVDEEPEFYMPETWRRRAESVKQGSTDEAVEVLEHPEGLEDLWGGNDNKWHPHLHVSYASHQVSLDTYRWLLRSGVCPEQARMVLPLSTYTEFWMTGSLAGWARVYDQRTDPHTQKETREVAKQIGEIIEPLFTVSWPALTKFLQLPLPSSKLEQGTNTE